MRDLLKATLAPFLEGVLRFIPDKNKRAEAAELFDTKLLDALTSLVQGQLEINKTEAQHASIFVAGWRPFIGWTCGVAIGWQFFGQPMLTWFVLAAGVDLPPLPILDIGPLLTLILGMLGLGGLRTYEKRLGVDRKNIE